jgi:4-carboxymuconolactone decarboxylase
MVAMDAFRAHMRLSDDAAAGGVRSGHGERMMARLGPAELSAEEVAFRKREGTSAPNLQLAVAHAPDVARLQLELARAATASMSPRERELIILVVGLVSDNAYCWGHHVPMALAAGMSEAEIRGIRADDYSCFPPDERALLQYCAAVVEQRVADEQWDAVSRGRTPAELVKITMLVSYYCLLGKIQSALQVEQDEGFGGFEQP